MNITLLGYTAIRYLPEPNKKHSVRLLLGTERERKGGRERSERKEEMSSQIQLSPKEFINIITYASLQ